jgi:hypothetical protein
LIVGNGTNLAGSLAAGSANNITSGSAEAAGLDPKGLQNNGGPTQTIALITGGTAVNAGSNAHLPGGVTTDQRGSGFPRIVSGTADIGAVESPFASPAPLLSTPSASLTSLGVGGTTILSVSVTDANGTDDLRYVHLMLAPQGSAVTPWATGGGLWMHFNAVERKLYPWTGSGWGTGIAQGSNGTLTTPQGTLTLDSNWATSITNGYRFNIAFTPNSSFTGDFVLRALAQDTQPASRWDLNSVKEGDSVTISAAQSSSASKIKTVPSGGTS